MGVFIDLVVGSKNGNSVGDLVFGSDCSVILIWCYDYSWHTIFVSAIIAYPVSGGRWYLSIFVLECLYLNTLVCLVVGCPRPSLLVVRFLYPRDMRSPSCAPEIMLVVDYATPLNYWTSLMFVLLGWLGSSPWTWTDYNMYNKRVVFG